MMGSSCLLWCLLTQANAYLSTRSFALRSTSDDRLTPGEEEIWIDESKRKIESKPLRLNEISSAYILEHFPVYYVGDNNRMREVYRQAIVARNRGSKKWDLKGDGASFLPLSSDVVTDS